MLTYKQCRELLDDAILILEDALDHEDISFAARKLIKEYITLTTRKKGGVPLNKYLTKQYDKAKALVAAGASIKDACNECKITRDQWYRRKSIETHGKSRIKPREY